MARRKVLGFLIPLISLAAAFLHSVRPSGAAELPDVRDLTSYVGILGGTLKTGTLLTPTYLDQVKIKQGTCEGKYNELPAGTYLIQGEVLNQFQAMSRQLDRLLAFLKPLTDLDQEVRARREALRSLQSQTQVASDNLTQTKERLEKLHETLQKEEDELSRVQQGQRVAVRDWLLREYGQTVQPPGMIAIGKDVVVISEVLFGTFLARYPKEVKPGMSPEMTVTFRPVPFVEALFGTEIEIGPAAEYSKPPPEGLVVQAATVQGETGLGRFQMGQRERVTFKRDLIWTWGTKVEKQFKGGEFSILMEGALPRLKATTGPQALARLPVDIGREPEPPWWAPLAPLFGPTIGAIVALLGRELIAWGMRRRRLKEQQASQIVRPYG